MWDEIGLKMINTPTFDLEPYICVYFVAVVLRYGGRFPGGTARACSLSHVLVPWESPPSLRTTNRPYISSKSHFKNKKAHPQLMVVNQ